MQDTTPQRHRGDEGSAVSRKRKRKPTVELPDESSPGGRVPVDFSALSNKGITMWPEDLRRGYYEDIPFTCVDCKTPQVWTGAQQKWWFEVMKAYVWSVARRCRACRAAMRAKKDAARAASGHTKKKR